MRNKKGCSRWVWILAGLGLLGSVGCLAGYILITARLNRLQSTQALNAPPTVMIDSPRDDLVVAPGHLLSVGTLASGSSRIERIELWMDGVKVDEAISTEAADLSAFSADFLLTIPVGQHMLVARAIDSASLVGQSLPRGIFADPQLARQENSNPPNQENPNPASQGNLLPPDQGNTPTAPSDVPNTPELEPSPLTGTYTLIDLIAGYTSASQPPKAPSDLKVQVQDCKMILTWQDNADNELAYGVWVKEIIGPGRRIASLKPSASTGPAWFQFDVLPIGVYGIWVEAVNWLGAQPSEIAWVRVDELGCATRTATELEFEVRKFDNSGPYKGVYCYLSAEGLPHVRIPAEPDYFWTGAGFPVPWFPGANAINEAKYLFRIPDDRVLDIVGDCFGMHSSNSPNPLVGYFSEALPESTWDGKERTLPVDQYLTMRYTIRPLGQTLAQGPYSYVDNSLPRPKLIDAKVVSPGAPVPDKERILTWEWDPKLGRGSLTGFTVFLNGIALPPVGPEARQLHMWLPASCGESVTFEVAANFGNSQSSKDKWSEVLPKCPIQVRVEFQQIFLEKFNPYVTNGTQFAFCSEEAKLVDFFVQARINFKLTRNNSSYGFLHPAIECGLWNFEDLFDQNNLSFTPPNVIEGQLTDRGDGLGTVSIASLFANLDGTPVARVEELIIMSLDDWDGYDNTYKLSFDEAEGAGWITVRVTGTKVKP